MANNQLKKEREERLAAVKKMVRAAGKNFDKMHLVMEVCTIFDVSQRKASEYIRIAQHLLK